MAIPREVLSTADSWLNYPHKSRELSRVSAATWGGPDYHRNYMNWWFGHLLPNGLQASVEVSERRKAVER